MMHDEKLRSFGYLANEFMQVILNLSGLEILRSISDNSSLKDYCDTQSKLVSVIQLIKKTYKVSVHDMHPFLLVDILQRIKDYQDNMKRSEKIHIVVTDCCQQPTMMALSKIISGTYHAICSGCEEIYYTITEGKHYTKSQLVMITGEFYLNRKDKEENGKG